MDHPLPRCARRAGHIHLLPLCTWRAGAGLHPSSQGPEALGKGAMCLVREIGSSGKIYQVLAVS